MNRARDWKTDPVQVNTWMLEQAQRLHRCGITVAKSSQMVFNRAVELGIAPDVLQTAITLFGLNLAAAAQFREIEERET